MAFVLATCMVPRAFALDDDGDGALNAASTEQEGTIIIENAVANARYDLYKIFNVTYDEENEKYAYTINEGDDNTGRWLNFFFDLDKLNADNVDNADYIKATNYIHIYDSDKDQAKDTKALYILVYKDKKYVLDINDNNVAQFATDALDFALSNNLSPYYSDRPSEDGVFRITGLDFGYYLVYPYGQSRYTNGGASVCNLLTNAPYKSINVKSTWPSITKQITSVTDTSGNVETGGGDGTVSVGDTVEFTIECKIPDPTGYSDYTLFITDSMSEGFKYVEGGHEVYLLGTDNQKTEISTNYYEFEEHSVNGKKDYNGFTFNLKVMDIQRDLPTLIGQKIKITYKAKVTGAAISSGANNSATITYSNDPSKSTSTATSTAKEIKVYTATLKVQKYDRDNASGDTLDGAEFYLYKLDSDNKPLYYSYNPETDPDTISWVSDISQGTKYTTPADGTIYFQGIDSGKYYLYEVKPPAGYNALTKPITVNISSTADSEGSLLIETNNTSPTAPTVTVVNLPGKGTVAQDVEAVNGTTFTYLIQVGNSGGKVLPSTGGAGAFVIYGVSAAALVAAIVLLVRKNRRRKQMSQL
jgi:LPXTG-motif cell wall-anchored protein